MLKIIRILRKACSDDGFDELIHRIEVAIAKFLSLLMLIVIGITIVDLVKFLLQQFGGVTSDFFGNSLLRVFGLFLNVLIALELLDNLTAYLHKNVANQLKLVIVTALIAVARKLIILDLEKTSGLDLIALGIAVLALAVSYWLVHQASSQTPRK